MESAKGAAGLGSKLGIGPLTPKTQG